MVNTYGYNRKTKEEDEKILAAVQRHHDIVVSRGYYVVMTSLVGSQNYDLDNGGSDIDTYSLIFPPIEEMALAIPPKAGLIVAKDGHCNFKDIRYALNLLKKTSPNSVEYFTSKYKVYNPVFKELLQSYFDDNSKMWDMIHCNYGHMIEAIAGMARQLMTRNMPAGKRYSHALRMDNMYYHFLNSYNANAILDMKMGGDRDLALEAKCDTDLTHDEGYNNGCEQIAEILDSHKDNFTITDEQKETEVRGLKLIDQLQLRLFKQYLTEIL